MERRDSSGSTAILRAVVAGCPRVLAVLLSRGGKVEAVDNDGRSCIDLAESALEREDMTIGDGTVSAAVVLKRHFADLCDSRSDSGNANFLAAQRLDVAIDKNTRKGRSSEMPELDMSRAPLEKKEDEFHQAILEECQQSNGEERRNGRDGLKVEFVLSDDVKEANDGQMENVIRPEPSRVVASRQEEILSSSDAAGGHGLKSSSKTEEGNMRARLIYKLEENMESSTTTDIDEPVGAGGVARKHLAHLETDEETR